MKKRLKMRQKTRMTASFRFSRLILLLLVIPASIQAQETSMVGVLPWPGEVVSSLSAGIGHTSAKDEFLSPLKYGGTAFSLSEDRWTAIGSGPNIFRILRTHNSLLFSSMKNDTGSGSMLQFMADVNCMWGCPFHHTDMFDFIVGPVGMLDIGALWNRRNSNNPANIEGNLALGAGAESTCRFSLWSYPMALQATLFIPVAGIGFAPDYDQPYWLMYTGSQYGRTLHFVHPFNCPSVCYDMSLNLPVKGGQVRLGWTADYTTNKLGGNRTRISHNMFNLGYVYRFERKYNGR